LCKKPGHWKKQCPFLAEAVKYLQKNKKIKQDENNNDKDAVTKSEKKNEEKSENDNVVFVCIEVMAANNTSLLDEYDVLCDNQATTENY